MIVMMTVMLIVMVIVKMIVMLIVMMIVMLISYGKGPIVLKLNQKSPAEGTDIA